MRGRGLSLLAPLVLSIVAAGPAAAQSAAPHGGDVRAVAGRLLAVPFVAQTERLCGGAALAMVRRYWGDPRAVAEDYAGLVDARTGGITTSRLREAARAGEWTALPLSGDAAGRAGAAGQVARGRPVIALIVDRPGVLHYVVIVGWTAETVIFHDPARGPLASMAADEFDRRWAPTGRWMLLVLPAPGSDPLEPTDATVMPPVNAHGGPCVTPVDEAIRHVDAGHLDLAAGVLDRALEICPTDARLWRERAGVAFLQREYARAERLAERATTLDPSDTQAWRLTGASRFMRGNAASALEALNRAGEPVIDRVLVDGTRGTPDPVVIGSTGLRPRQMLTAAAFRRAARRLESLPSVRQAMLTYRPGEGDAVVVRAAVAERDASASGWLALGVLGGRAVFTDSVAVAVASPTRSGELWRAEGRWAAARPRAAFALATPVRGLPGIATVEGSWEQQVFAAGPAARRQTRQRAAAGLSDWASGSLRWQAMLGLERIDDQAYLAAAAGLDRRLHHDRASIGAVVEGWVDPRARASGFGRASAVVALRSSARDVPGWSARAGASLATSRAPLILWPTAGTGSDSQAPLRAHPLTGDGVVSGVGLGRQVVFVSLEGTRPVLSGARGQVWWASFVDVAGISHRLGHRSTLHVDLGTGLRFRVPWCNDTIGLDVAYGARDGRVRFSASVRHRWPGR